MNTACHRYPALWVVAALLLAISTLCSCSVTSPLEILDHQLTAREFTGEMNQIKAMAAVTGTARNNSDSAINNCIITVTFYDSNRNNIGTASTTRASLGQGETWQFAAQLTAPDAWKARTYSILSSCQ